MILINFVNSEMKKNVTTTLRTELPYVLDWPRWSSYEVAGEDRLTNSLGGGADRLVYPTGERLAPRLLTQEIDLVNPFAEIAVAPNEKQEQRLLEFIREFGLLGQSVLAGGNPPPIVDAPPIVLRATKRRPTPLQVENARRMADGLGWALSHARNVDLIMRLHQARRGDLDRLLDWLNGRIVKVRVPEGFAFPTKEDAPSEDDFVDESWASKRRPGLLRAPLLAAPWFDHHRLAELSQPGDSALDRSRRVIAALLDPNLRDVQRVTDWWTGTARFQFRALIQLLYWQLADRLGRWSIRRCRCGVMFFADHGNQESHSPQCFRRFYMRDHRKGDLRRKRLPRKTGRKAK
jgi:hypothetical protein